MNIAIVGAGLGGLACARILQMGGRSVTVFEGEPSPGARSQGGTLDVHADSGQVALRTAGLLDRFRALSRPEGQEWRTLTPDGTVVGHDWPDDDRPEIDRGQLRGLFLEALAEGTVRWGRGVAAVAPPGRVVFEDGTSQDFDLVVGADGAWSRVRAAVTGAVPEYTGVTFVEAWFDDTDRRHPRIAHLVGNGTMVAKVPGKGLFAQRNSNGHIRVYAAVRAPENPGLDFDDAEGVRAHLLRLYDGWSENLRDLLRDNDGPFIHRPLYALPVPHVWRDVPGFTLVGDAAHLMPPLGLGANLAMLDGAELATALVTEPTVEAAVRAYESVMMPRSVEAAKACKEGLDHLLPADGVQYWSPMQESA
ncbi:FAD-dependent oxidoreductase [Nonomuraea sp. NPDC050536]|uniref:FAD-dependent oxidoreductase n=1 Tax=Nonomuraea sp. NPDC050536 TaxID=3364366 RepID=UPI0037C718FA